MSMDVSMEMLKFYADKYRGHSKTGPYWSAIIRIPYMYDEIVRLKKETEVLKEEMMYWQSRAVNDETIILNHIKTSLDNNKGE